MIEIISDHKPTNADRIRGLNDEKLAEIIMCPYDTEPDSCNKKGCYGCCLEWLQQPEE